MVIDIMLLSTILAAGGDMNLKFDIETYRLQNGLTVFLLEDHSLPIVAVDVNYNVGSKNETRGKTGFAHLFEHIMFQGSKHFNDDYFKALQDIGGEVNGATNQDRTRYYEIVPSNYLERALWLESDRMGYLLDALTEERLKNQISVVINEYRQNYENRPYGMVYFELLKLLFPPHHPYSWPTIGVPEDIKNATLADVVDFFKTYYSVNNATIAIAGDINKEETKRLVEKYFGSFRPSRPVKYISEWTPALTENKSLIMRENVNLPKIYIAFPTTAAFKKYDAELDIIAKVLGENENSRLYKRLVKEKKIASEVSASQVSGQISGYFTITATLYPESSPETAREIIFDEIKKIATYSITTDELEQAKSYFKSDFIRSLKRLGGFGGIADRINYYYQVLKRPDMFEFDLNRYLMASSISIKEAVNRFLMGHYAEIIVLPEKTKISENIEIDRSKMPQGKEEKEIEFPRAHKTTTADGIELYTMPYTRLPLSYLSVIIPVGYADDGKRYGIANFTANMLLKGTKELKEEDIQSKLDKLGSTISVQVDADSTTIMATFLNDRAEDTIKLLSEILFKPSFDKREIEIQKEIYQNQLRRAMDQLQFLATVTTIKQYFKDDPYGHLYLGDFDFLRSVDREEIVQFYNNYILAKRPIVIYTGSFKTDEVKGHVERYLSKFKLQQESSKEKKEDRKLHKALKVFLADKKGSSQSHIMVAFRGVMRRDEGYESAYIANTLFGGYFLSRLNMRLREEKGFTYGARSYINFFKRDSVWMISTSVQIEDTSNAIKEIINVIREMKKPDSITDEELKNAKGYVVKRFPIEYETIDSLHAKLKIIALYNLGEDAINREYKNLKNKERGDIIKIVRDYFDPENLIIVVAGDRERILNGLKDISKDVIEVNELGDTK